MERGKTFMFKPSQGMFVVYLDRQNKPQIWETNINTNYPDVLFKTVNKEEAKVYIEGYNNGQEDLRKKMNALLRS